MVQKSLGKEIWEQHLGSDWDGVNDFDIVDAVELLKAIPSKGTFNALK
jgi:hypothetical protein